MSDWDRIAADWQLLTELGQRHPLFALLGIAVVFSLPVVHEIMVKAIFLASLVIYPVFWGIVQLITWKERNRT